MAEYEKLLPPPLAVDASFRALAALLNDWPNMNVDLVRTLAHIEDADPVLLQHIAEWFSLSDEPAWTYAADDNARRRLAAGAVMLHRLKGTPWAVKRVLNLIGMGAGTRLIEGGIPATYNGDIIADGSHDYGGSAWAEYSLEADLGENAGLDAGTGTLIKEVVSGVAPARCHLKEITYRIDVEDSVETGEETALTVECEFSDMPSKLRYDGSRNYDWADRNTYDGSVIADGSENYSGWHVPLNVQRFGDEEDPLTLDVSVDLSDKVGIYHRYDGTRLCDGSVDYGASMPCCIDEPMMIEMTEIVRYNGKHCYDGILAAGVVKTLLEVA